MGSVARVWLAEWFDSNDVAKYKRPVIKLLRSLYGHPEAGSHWERHLSKELIAMGAVPVEEFGATFVFSAYRLALIVYVDGFILASDEKMRDLFWKELGERVLIDNSGDL